MTIESVLNQGYPDLEYIVVDGGSTDGTIDILKRYSGRLKWVSEKDSGQANAINKGLGMCTGDIIGYLNSDDTYEAGALKKVSEFFAKNPSCAWLTGLCRIIDERGRDIRRPVGLYKNLLLRFFNTYTTLLISNYISQPATFLRKGVFKGHGPFDEKEARVFDYEYWLRVGRVSMPCVLWECLASFRVYPETKTSAGFRSAFKEELCVARRYSGSRIVNAAHYLNYASIIVAYSLFQRLGKRP
jgi:glycosyltransferase involved in cell wall biosynthesis